LDAGEPYIGAQTLNWSARQSSGQPNGVRSGLAGDLSGGEFHLLLAGSAPGAGGRQVLGVDSIARHAVS
jgi:hypothetical protein